MNPALVLLVVIAVILYLAFQLFISARKAMKSQPSIPDVPDVPTATAPQQTGPPSPQGENAGGPPSPQGGNAGGFGGYLRGIGKSLFPGLIGSKKQRVPATPKPDSTPIAGEDKAPGKAADQIGNFFNQSWQGLGWG